MAAYPLCLVHWTAARLGWGHAQLVTRGTSLAGHFVTPVVGPAGHGQVAACVLLIYDARFFCSTSTIFCSRKYVDVFNVPHLLPTPDDLYNFLIFVAKIDYLVRLPVSSVF